MLNISKPLSASQAQNYHTKEFTAAEQNYWKQEDTIQGEWRGKLAEEFGLSGAVGALELTRLMGTLLYHVSPRDPAAFGSAVAVMAVAALGACWLPAWRASRTDPVRALRF